MKNGLIIDEYGNKKYYLNDLLHREDGPAIEWLDGDCLYYSNGKPHRLDGPAYVAPPGNLRGKYDIWYYQGELIDCHSQKEFERWLKLRMFM